MAERRFFQDSTDTIAFGAGATIFAEGDPGEAMYVVQSGTVEIRQAGAPVNTLGPGEIFGELALIDQSPRSATARASSDCRLVALNEQRFLFSIQHSPLFALEVLRTLARRLRAR